jgi:hypothetical protein
MNQEPRFIILSDAGLPLITVNFLVPANQHPTVPVKQRIHLSGAVLLLIMADSSGPAGQNSLNSKY